MNWTKPVFGNLAWKHSFEQWRCFLGRFFLQERTQLVIQRAGPPAVHIDNFLGWNYKIANLTEKWFSRDVQENPCRIWNTLPKTSSSHLPTKCSQKERIVLQPAIFGCHVSFKFWLHWDDSNPQQPTFSIGIFPKQTQTYFGGILLLQLWPLDR